MAGASRNLPSLVRRALACGESSITQQSGQLRSMASESKAFSAEGRYMQGIYSRTKPVDRSHEWVAKNPYIEAWYYRRDNFEKEFVWNFRNTVEAVWLIGGFTFGAYYLSEFCMRQADRRSGLPRRQILGEEPGFVLPDEREFY